MTLLGLFTAFGAVALQGTAPIDPAFATRVFSECQALSRLDNGGLWGDPLYGPMMLVAPNTRYVVANMQDLDRRLTRTGDVFVGYLPQDLAIKHSTATWGGRTWTMLYSNLPSLEHARGKLAMRESFRRIQGSLGLTHADDFVGHLDDQEGRKWLRLEMVALSEALQSSGEARKQATRDAIDFRTKRKIVCGPKAAGREQRLELDEGLAEYTGLVLSGYGRDTLAGRAAQALEAYQARGDFSADFASATGPAYGLLLDGSEAPYLNKPDNMGIDERGNLLIQEDPGNNAQLARIIAYDLDSGDRGVVAEFDPALFRTGAPGFLTQDEESSGIIDASEVFGKGWFLFDAQVHKASPDQAKVELGQLLALRIPRFHDVYTIDG